jgi:hypothetical protein
MNFLRKNRLSELVFLSSMLTWSAAAMELHHQHTNFVHLTELSKNNPNQQLDNALYSFESSSNVFSKVNDAIRQGADVKAIYEDTKTPLHKAFEFPDITIAAALVKASPSIVNFRDKQGNTMLSDAISKKNITAVEFLLENKINLKRGICPLKLVIDNARDNRPSARGGLSCWPLTEELVYMVARASSPETIKKAQEYLKSQPYNDHYAIHIRKPLNNVAAEKELRWDDMPHNDFSSSKRKSTSGDNGSLPVKKRKITNDNLYSSAPASLENVRAEGKRQIRPTTRFAPVKEEEANKKREKRFQLQKSHDGTRRIKK